MQTSTPSAKRRRRLEDSEDDNNLWDLSFQTIKYDSLPLNSSTVGKFSNEESMSFQSILIDESKEPFALDVSNLSGNFLFIYG